MEKVKVKEIIHWSQKDNHYLWKDIKHVPFEDDDVIQVQYVEPYYSENESYDGHFICEISRMVEETDEQFEMRMKRRERIIEDGKKRRYENYLKLKAQSTTTNHVNNQNSKYY